MKILGKINKCVFGHKFNTYTKTKLIHKPDGKTSKILVIYRRCTDCGLFQRKSDKPILKNKWITIEK
jgi:hypothetical protein